MPLHRIYADVPSHQGGGGRGEEGNGGGEMNLGRTNWKRISENTAARRRFWRASILMWIAFMVAGYSEGFSSRGEMALWVAVSLMWAVLLGWGLASWTLMNEREQSAK